MNDKKNVPRSDYSVDEILAEAQIRKEHTPPEQAAKTKTDVPARERPSALDADEILARAQQALNVEAGAPAPDGVPPEKEEKRKGLFRRRKKKDDEPPAEDIYYGLQLKSLEEYRKEYEQTILLDKKEIEDGAQEAEGKSSFPYLFRKEESGVPEPLGTEEKDRRERHERLERILNRAGLDADEMLGAQEAPAGDEDETPGTEQVPAGKTGTEETPVPEEPSAGKAEAEKTPAPEEIPAEKTDEAAGSPAEAGRSSPRPKPPAYPPKPPVRNPDRPPVPPAVEPGPAMEPEIRPPIVEPPLVPAVGEESAAAAVCAAQEEARADAAPASARTAEPEETPPPVREPSAPPRVKEEIPPAAPRKEPAERPAPQYRAGGLPVQVIELADFDDVLAAEAASYPQAAPAAPEPIPFPPAEERTAAPPREQEDAGGGKAEIRSVVFAKNAVPEPEKPKKKFRLFGSDEESNDPLEEPEEGEAELDDYSGPADAPSVMNDLASNVRRLMLRFAVTAICCVTTLALGILREYPGAVPEGLHSLFEAPTYEITELLFLLFACVFSVPTLWNGIRGLFTFQANSDSAAAVAAAAAACQGAAFLISGPAGGIPLYVPLAAAALFLNAAGKFSMARRILGNFRFLSSPEQKYAVQLFDDHNTALVLARDSTIGEPEIAYQAKASFLRNFLRDSYAPDPSDHVSQLTAPAGFLASLGLCIVTAAMTRNAGTALAAFAASACVCVPFANMLSVNLPLAHLSHIAEKNGAMAVGWPAVERFCRTNAVMLNAQDLFPRGTVILSGIQTFAGQRIDEAIVDATALAASAGGPLNDLFSQIVRNRGDFLPHVSRPSYEDGMGISGAVEDRVILIGNRELMQKHGIDAPSRDYEEKYVRAGKHPLYLASAGTLVAMFLVSYRSDRRRAMELRRMENNGIALIVRTRDPQITPELLAECFGLSRNSVRVLPERLGEVYDGLTERAGGRPEAVLATKGRASGMLRMLTACVRQRSNISIAVALQAAGAALGFALVAFFAAYAGLAQLSVTSLSVFEAFWAASVLFVPRIRRP